MKTDATTLFGTRYPIVAGGLQYLADRRYVAACARAGIMGFMTINHLPDEPTLRQEIRLLAEEAEGAPFGVNIPLPANPAQNPVIERMMRVACEEGVRFVETSGRSPEPFMPILKEGGAKVLHKAPGVAYARKAQSVGVDIVAIVGAECGGHPGANAVGSMVNGALALDALSIPYLIGGGIGHGSQLAAALAMGASGVLIGTRFLVAEEIWAHENYKRALLEARETDTVVTLQTIRKFARTLPNETTRSIGEIERLHPDGALEALLPHIAGSLGREAYTTGDVSTGLIFAGQALGFANAIDPVAAIVERIMDECRTSLDRLERWRGAMR